MITGLWKGRWSRHYTKKELKDTKGKKERKNEKRKKDRITPLSVWFCFSEGEKKKKKKLFVSAIPFITPTHHSIAPSFLSYLLLNQLFSWFIFVVFKSAVLKLLLVSEFKMLEGKHRIVCSFCPDGWNQKALSSVVVRNTNNHISWSRVLVKKGCVKVCSGGRWRWLC